MKPSQLDRTIPPEIKDDEFYFAIVQFSSKAAIKTVLEVGSSAGGGSTEAFVQGLAQNPNRPTLFCLEVSKPRFKQLEERYRPYPFVKCYNMSSVPTELFPKPEAVTKFYNSTRTPLNQYPLKQVLGWLEQDLEYVRSAGVPQDGIQRIKGSTGIEVFDAVLIDGSEFSGSSELDVLYGAKLIMLDDIATFKNYHNFDRLKADPRYKLILENRHLRNGFAVFKRSDYEFSFDGDLSESLRRTRKAVPVLQRIKQALGRVKRSLS